MAKGINVVIDLELAKAAKKAGGDRYTDNEDFTAVYVDQSVSRKKGDDPADELQMKITSKALKNAIKLELDRPAKKSGGDRYAESNPKGDRAQIFYIPQAISRGEEDDPVEKLYISFK